MADHYQTLGIAKTATPDEIKKAYRKLASKHHPDKGGDTSTFQQIEEAYRILSDPQQRQQYDNPSPFQDFGQGAPGGFSFHTGGGGFDDMFAQFFRQTQQQQRPQQQLFRTTINVTLEQVYNGGEQVLRLQTHNNIHHVKVDIPKGVHDGSQLRIDNVIDGASLLVDFRINKHLKFDRLGDDLACNHPISVLDLITGTTFEFTTLSGKTLEVTVKPLTQPYIQLKIAKQGMPIYGMPNQFGDQIILLKPFIPDTVDERIIDSILQTKNNPGV
jgi:DnaJ-class molecular chaperone